MATIKRLRHVKIADEDKGIVDLVFSTFNVVDSDRDVTRPGAFEEGAKVAVSSYQHTSWEGALPVGVATLTSTTREGRAKAQFFLDTTHGADTFTTVKRLHGEGIGEWSYGYDPVEYSFGEHEGQHVRFLDKVKVHEVSPVLVGAGINTRTLSAKNRGGSDPGDTARPAGYSGAIRPHTTDVDAKAWIPNAVARELTFDASVSDLRSMHAWCDPSGNPERKASYAFMHHAGPHGPANVRACLLGIAALNGAAGPSIPDSAKQGVYDHLASHLRDAGRVPPEFRPDGNLKLNERAMVLLTDLGELVDYAVAVGAARASKGRGLTDASTEILGWIADALSDVKGLFDTPDETAAREFLRMVANQRGLRV